MRRLKANYEIGLLCKSRSREALRGLEPLNSSRVMSRRIQLCRNASVSKCNASRRRSALPVTVASSLRIAGTQPAQGAILSQQKFPQPPQKQRAEKPRQAARWRRCTPSLRSLSDKVLSRVLSLSAGAKLLCPDSLHHLRDWSQHFQSRAHSSFGISLIAPKGTVYVD